jgi:hypothetical protein
MDLSIVKEKVIGDLPQSLLRLFVRIRYRLLAQVTTGHYQDQGLLPLFLLIEGEEESVEWGIREENPQELVMGSHLLGDQRSRALSQQDDGPGGLQQGFLFLSANLTEFPDRRHVFNHDRKGLLLPPLSFSQAFYRLGIRGIYCQVKPTQSLDGQYLPLFQQVIGRLDRLSLCCWFVLQPESGAAIPAGIRLRVKPPIVRIFIFGTAERTHRENPHRGPLPIVRDILNDAIARTTVGTIQERIGKSAVLGRKELVETIRASGNIGRDEGGALSPQGAVQDREILIPLGRHSTGNKDPIDMGQWGNQAREIVHELIQYDFFPFCFDLYSPRGIGNPSPDPLLLSQSKDIGAKSNALDDALYFYLPACHHLTAPAFSFFPLKPV